jgi:hypothetical protein
MVIGAYMLGCAVPHDNPTVKGFGERIARMAPLHMPCSRSRQIHCFACRSADLLCEQRLACATWIIEYR